MSTTGEGTLLYKRILLKLSGEALISDNSFGIDATILARLTTELLDIMAYSVQVAIVIGGGNLFRGAALSKTGLDRVTADQMGMLATVMNALAMRDILEKSGVHTRVMSAIPLSGLVDHYDRRKAIHHLGLQRCLIFAAGTGNPFVTTDSAASLRSIEINADCLLKATKVDGIYSADPVQYPDATRYEKLTYQEALEKELGIMDLAAFCQCRDYNMPIRVFNMHKPGSLLRIVKGESEGTLVTRGEL